jgi:hypothetical protein
LTTTQPSRDRSRLALLALAAADVQVVHDPQQPRSNAELLVQVKLFPPAQSAQVGLLHEVFGACGVARQPARCSSASFSNSA